MGREYTRRAMFSLRTLGLPGTLDTLGDDMIQKKPKKSSPVLRITMKSKNSVLIRVLRPERIIHSGFGTFVENVKPGELSVTTEARIALESQPYRSGLQGMEIFAGNIIAYGDPRPTIEIPLGDISFHNGAEKWFEKCCVIDNSTD